MRNGEIMGNFKVEDYRLYLEYVKQNIVVYDDGTFDIKIKD